MTKPPAVASAFDRLVRELAKLPGIGNRSAQRIAFDLLRRSESDARELADAICAFKTDLKVCSICGHVSEADPCPICNDPKRDRGLILVVEQPGDVVSIEQTGAHRGVYHVLMGRLAPLEGIGPGDLNIDRLLDRVRQPADSPDGGTTPVREIIVGTNPTLEGDGTALYLAEQLQRLGVTVSRLARGLPTGSNLEGLSKAVLSDALQGRHGMPDPAANAGK